MDVPTVERAFKRLGITGQLAAVLMILFGALVIAFPDITDFLLGSFLVATGLLQLGGNLLAVRLTRRRAS